MGKTSLANILPSALVAARGEELAVASINCDTTDDYASLMHKLLQEIIIVQRIRGIGFGNYPTREENPLSQSLPDSPRPNDVRLLLQAIAANSLLILDEFDRVTDQNSVRLVSDTLKTLSDRAVPATIVLVGVADNVDGLLSEHQSIERCLTQVQMPRMTQGELTDIVDKGLNQVNMIMDGPVRWYIPAVSQGYPHFTHLLALDAARKAVREGRNVVLRHDIESTIGHAIARTEHSIQSIYLKAVYSAHSAAMYEEVLLACALADTDELNYFNSQSVREQLSRILERPVNIPAFSRHLDAFSKEERGPALIKEGQSRRHRYRFAVPLLRPYVLLKGISGGRIKADALR